jgi:hypothetical protein
VGEFVGGFEGGLEGGFDGGLEGGFVGGLAGGLLGGFAGGFDGGLLGGFAGGFVGGSEGGSVGGLDGGFEGGFVGGFTGCRGGEPVLPARVVVISCPEQPSILSDTTPIAEIANGRRWKPLFGLPFNSLNIIKLSRYFAQAEGWQSLPA